MLSYECSHNVLCQSSVLTEIWHQLHLQLINCLCACHNTDLHHFHCILATAIFIECCNRLVLLLVLFGWRFHLCLRVIPINLKTSDSRLWPQNISHDLDQNSSISKKVQLQQITTPNTIKSVFPSQCSTKM